MPVQFPQLNSAYGNLGAATMAGGLAGLAGKFLDTFVTDEAKASKSYYDRAFNKALEMKKAGLSDSLINQYLKSAIDAPAANIMKQEAPFLNMLGVNTVQEPDYLPALRASLSPQAVLEPTSVAPDLASTRINEIQSDQDKLKGARQEALSTLPGMKPNAQLKWYDIEQGKNKKLVDQLDTTWKQMAATKAQQDEADPEYQTDLQLAQTDQNLIALNQQLRQAETGLFSTDRSKIWEHIKSTQEIRKQLMDTKKLIQELKFAPTDKVIDTLQKMSDQNPSAVAPLVGLLTQRTNDPKILQALQGIQSTSVPCLRLQLTAQKQPYEIGKLQSGMASDYASAGRAGIAGQKDLYEMLTGGASGGADLKEIRKTPGQVKKETEQAYNTARTNVEQIYKADPNYKMMKPTDQNKLIDFLTVQRLNGAPDIPGEYRKNYSDPVTFWNSPEGKQFSETFDYTRSKNIYINRETENRLKELGAGLPGVSAVMSPQQFSQQYLGVQPPGQQQTKTSGIDLSSIKTQGKVDLKNLTPKTQQILYLMAQSTKDFYVPDEGGARTYQQQAGIKARHGNKRGEDGGLLAADPDYGFHVNKNKSNSEGGTAFDISGNDAAAARWETIIEKAGGRVSKHGPNSWHFTVKDVDMDKLSGLLNIRSASAGSGFSITDTLNAARR